METDICVVMPTVREYEACRSYVRNARRNDFDVDRLEFVLVTEDDCDVAGMRAMLDELGVSGAIFDRTRRKRWFADQGLERHADLIPARSHAQTSFGLLYLWAGDFDYGMFLDDDTRPHAAFDFFGTHLENLAYDGELECVGSDRRWVNVLYQGADDHELYPRGFPYGQMGETVETVRRPVSDVIASQGLWTNVPDLDAVRILLDGDLRGQARTRLTAADYGDRFVIEPGQYLTICSMNLAFRREVVPAFYQLPMDDNPWDVGRFDDIWSGVFLKRAADILGKQIISGQPLCVHDKAPRSTFSDLANEAPALELNEHLWRIVDGVGAEASTFAEAYLAMADALTTETWDLRNGEYLHYVGDHMHRWVDCLETLDHATPTRISEVPADD